MPNSDSASSVRPAPSRPVRPSTSPRCSVKPTSAYSPRRVRPRPRAAAAPRACRGRRCACSIVEPGHQLADAPRVDLADRPGADLAAVAHHRDPLGDLDHLVEPVADEDDGDAVGLQPLDDAEQPVDLGAGQRGGGLVHEQQPRVGGEAAADRDDLALGDRQGGDRRVERRGGSRAAPSTSPRDPPHRGPAHRPQRRAERAVDGDVLGDRQIREQRQVLEDHLDAERLGLGRVERQRRRAVDLDRRRGRAGARRRPSLISVDLPQPFSPTRQCTSPRRTSQSIRSSASTPPKRLLTPVSRRNGVSSGMTSSVGGAAGAAGGAPRRFGQRPMPTSSSMVLLVDGLQLLGLDVAGRGIDLHRRRGPGSPCRRSASSPLASMLPTRRSPRRPASGSR